MKNLLIIDMENDFCPGGSIAATEGDIIVPFINRLIINRGYDHILTNKDWYPESYFSF